MLAQYTVNLKSNFYLEFLLSGYSFFLSAQIPTVSKTYADKPYNQGENGTVGKNIFFRNTKA